MFVEKRSGRVFPCRAEYFVAAPAVVEEKARYGLAWFERKWTALQLDSAFQQQVGDVSSEDIVNAIDLSELNVEQLVQLIASAKRALYPEARIVGGELECSVCHQRGFPVLVEEGMTVTHNLQSISAECVKAKGWDGSSSDVSEEGETLVLECPHCFQWHRMPAAIELEWL